MTVLLFGLDGMTDEPQEDPALLIRTGSIAACEERINVLVGNFTAASNAAPAAAGSKSLPNSKVSSARSETLLDETVVPTETVPLTDEAGNWSAIAKVVAALIANVSLPQRSALYAVYTSSPAGSDVNKPSVAGRALAVRGVPITSSTDEATISNEAPSKTKSVGGTCSALLITKRPRCRCLAGWRSFPFPPRVIRVVSIFSGGVKRFV